MSYKVKIIGNIEEQEKTWDLIHFLSQQHGMSEEEADIFAVAVGEAYGNGLLYSPDKYSELLIDFKKDQIIVEIENNGKEIDFKAIEEFDNEQDFQMYRDGKLGIPMIKVLVDDIKYSHSNGKNKLVLSKKIKSDKNVLKGEKNEN